MICLAHRNNKDKVGNYDPLDVLPADSLFQFFIKIEENALLIAGTDNLFKLLYGKDHESNVGNS